MSHLFRKLKNFKGFKRNRQKEGSSMVSVIIGVLFLSAIGLTILTVATRYIVTVIVDRGSSDNFYQTEGILEEVKTGLLEYAGDASETAYKDILENYSATTGEMKKTFAKKYFSEFAAKITGTSYVWDDSKLGVVQPCDLDKVKTLSKMPDAVTTMPGTNLGFVINYDTTKGYSLTLKNLLIDYTNPTEYRSTIHTDIVFKVPDFKFEGDSTLDELKNYIVISDDTLEVTNSNASAGVTFTGNVYTGNTDAGIEVATQNGATFRSQTIISRGSLDVLTGANVDITGESGAGDCWLQNIRLRPRVSGDDSALSTQFTMNENAYVANDLDIGDNNSVVSISGKYYGYSYNEENTTSALTPKAKFSSAILVNGLNTTLKTDGLDKLILAGRTFVSRDDPKSGAVNSGISDIMMGESLAVKSNQIAYLLPNEYIAAEHNPVLESEDRTVLTDNLLKSDIGKYLDTNEPYTANYNNNGYVYYYLKFKDEKNANEYFRNYYEGTGQDEDGNTVSNKDQLDERAQSYISTSDGSGMKLSPNLFLIAGNIIHNYYASGGSDIQGDNYYDNIGNPKSDLLEDGKRIGQGYVGRQLTLLPSGVAENYPAADEKPEIPPDSMRLVDGAPALVADKVIDFSKVTGIMDKTDSGSGGRIYVVPGDYEVDGAITKGIIISGGNVKVSSDFTGLILAKGTVTTARSNLKLTADIVLTGKLMEVVKKDKDLAEIFRALNGSEKQETTNLSECISYQNWEKNED